ncbi:MAG: 1-acyl-sn-glycerol-3-phosphate acyltransferase [Hydrogenophaga sp.]|jgi:1-acyl-sn-glycerol-3-phosphate acyltransferase|nr:1-acyl-sn-glycerol-3-phosphate acyltransferase [Hydrogenophaga sp.]
MNWRAQAMSLFLLGLVRLLTGAQARWHGCPPKAEQRIYFANHQSHADLVLIWAALPQELRSITRPIAAKDYWTTSRFKRWITTDVFNAVYVDRGNRGQIPISPDQPPLAREKLESDPDSSDPLQPLIDALESGDSLILFPEGTRGHAEDPQTFKSGLYNLARRFPTVVLVPAWIHNVQRVMPKGEVVPVPVLCSVTFGEPVQPGANEDRAAFLTRARAAMMALREV